MNCKYVNSLMLRLEFPSEHIGYLSDVCARLRDGYAKFVDSRLPLLFESDNDKLTEVQTQLKYIAEEMDVNPYTLDLLFLLCGCEELEKKYYTAGYSEKLFLDTMKDLKYKLDECLEVEGVAGVFTYGWFLDYYRMKRFYLGRFQFEFIEFPKFAFSVNGYTVRKGEKVLNMHIPSNGISLTDEVRLGAYKEAYEFFKKDFPKGYIPMCCNSWLLYPENEKIFPENSNLLKFMHDFAIVDGGDLDGFAVQWRVFGIKEGEIPYEDLPENSSLQRAMKKWIVVNRHHGTGQGIFFFDGEKIIR